MEQWISENLSNILDFPIPEDLIQYINSIENNNDLEEYMKTLIDLNDPSHKQFYDELVKKRTSKGSGKNQKNKSVKSKNHNEVPKKQITVVDPPVFVPEKDSKTSKKKTKYVNLYSQEGQNAQVVLLKGRHRCDCQASKHTLVNNCIRCGRIVCKQEGSGPCLFCGNLVCTIEEMKEINSKTKGGMKLMESLLEKSRPKGWEEAMLQRNKLLEYDRTSEQRTRVTDDDSDYFNTNSVWLSSSEKEKLEKYQQSLHEKKHQSRLKKKMTFDFAGRQVVEDNTIDYEVDEQKIRDITSGSASSGQQIQHNFFTGNSGDRDVAPGINAPLLEFDQSVESYSQATKAGHFGLDNMSLLRVQDSGLQEMTDTGKCLSMHQPWASLLVEGIKIHEGRTWYTSHRGRLWIASTAKPPEPDVVKAVENMCRMTCPNKEIAFPSFYPTGCLLGCVNVDDCLPQEEYSIIYPDGESDSPYILICSNPISLRLRFPIKGQHKIYNLDKNIHLAAVKSIQKMAKLQAEALNQNKS